MKGSKAMKNTGKIQVGSVLVSTMSRGTPVALAYEVISKDDDTVSVRPIEWARFTATVSEVTEWGGVIPGTDRRTPNKTRQVQRVFGRPAKGERSGEEEQGTIERLGKFDQFGVEWPERKEKAFLYTEGSGYAVGSLRDRAPKPQRDE